MQALIHAISGVLTLIFMGLIGCYLAKIGWINKDNKALLPKLVTNVSLPLFLSIILHMLLVMTNYYI